MVKKRIQARTFQLVNQKIFRREFFSLEFASFDELRNMWANRVVILKFWLKCLRVKVKGFRLFE